MSLTNRFFTISTILSLAAPAMPLFQGDSGTHSVLTIKTHQQGPFTMAIISSQSSRMTSPPSYGIKNGARRTNISSGHNYVWQYFVSLTIELPCTQMMCFDVACIFWQYCTPKLVLQCKTTKGLQEYFVPDVPRSSGTVVLGVQDFCVQYWFRSRSPTQTVIWH